MGYLYLAGPVSRRFMLTSPSGRRGKQRPVVPPIPTCTLVVLGMSSFLRRVADVLALDHAKLDSERDMNDSAIGHPGRATIG